MGIKLIFLARQWSATIFTSDLIYTWSHRRLCGRRVREDSVAQSCQIAFRSGRRAGTGGGHTSSLGFLLAIAIIFMPAVVVTC
jgi:hypothetical protein